MRHFLLSGAISPLALGVEMATTTGALVAGTGGAYRPDSGGLGAPGAAVAVAAVAVAAEEDCSAAGNAVIPSSG